jgi:hypothetical protein
LMPWRLTRHACLIAGSCALLHCLLPSTECTDGDAHHPAAACVLLCALNSMQAGMLDSAQLRLPRHSAFCAVRAR